MRSPLLALIFLTACASSSEPTSTTGDATAPRTPSTPSTPTPRSTCTAPKIGRYTVDVTPKTSCEWWDQKRDHADMNILEEAVRYPNSDDLCGDVQWNGCTLQDECGPLKFSAGSQGWYGKGSLSITFADDEHFTGTVTYDIGAPCVMTIEVEGSRLPL